ncbi:Asp23/Gls24 family envelope stress response protein [Nocardia otitidiscaviarum]|uniref:Asp23/Gls24 family envelope stress response protein n=1 Tax=Nocardia otitidiscaviarum TaxID=1823 RepID=UPI0004A6B2A7|nr:Asp23/Gls24 family envelope stress response protein [Nocardia otitidiscaviarum]MBF6137305.1 Asp23/Gls24 family envelope stress response protein [Nocardia otitidiscaviarum]MBF6488201.1 Asp23/Gls24 family envelope stress response protein [Nocardia otitidiscaviarum]
MTVDAELVVSDAVVAAVAARAAASVPGVARLEPGLRGLVVGWARLGKQLLIGQESAASEGVRVQRTATGGLAVQVDLSLGAESRAVTVGAAVQRAVIDTVREQTGVTVDEVSVTILDIEPGAL